MTAGAGSNRVVETILGRRSVREGFSDRAVDRSILVDVVRCGLAAPSSKNARPWVLHVVTDLGLLRDCATLIESAEGIDEYVPCDPATGRPGPAWRSTVVESANILRLVPSAIFVENRGVFSSGRQALVKASPDALAASLVGYTLEAMGLGAAVQNMWLAAVAHGLSGVFMGDVLIAEREIGRKLDIRGDLVGVLALGYANSSVDPSPFFGGEPPGGVRWFTAGGES